MLVCWVGGAMTLVSDWDLVVVFVSERLRRAKPDGAGVEMGRIALLKAARS